MGSVDEAGSVFLNDGSFPERFTQFQELQHDASKLATSVLERKMERTGELQVDSGMEEEEEEEEEEEDTEKKRKEAEAELEKEAWRCLNSVHEMLCLRQILNQTLRKGWMELASARYELGPARISQTLFSRKPQAAKAAVDVSSRIESEGDEELSTEGPVLFKLIKDSSEQRQNVAAHDDGINPNNRKSNSSSQLRRRPVSIPADTEKDELLQYANLIDDSDSEDDLQTLKVQKSSLQGFGAMVTVNLRNSQGSFVKALQDMVELLNAQTHATDAHLKAKKLQANIDNFIGQ